MTAHCSIDVPHWSGLWVDRMIETYGIDPRFREQLKGELLRVHGRGAEWQRNQTKAPPGHRISYVPVDQWVQDQQRDYDMTDSWRGWPES